MKVAVLGASGFVGTALAAALTARGDEVIAISLRDPARAAVATAGTDVVINLAGEPVVGRWTAERKRAIARSRVDAPHAFLDALQRTDRRPAAYVSASAVGYYGSSRDATFTESSPPGDDFLARVCVAWEAEANRARELGMRVVAVRTGLALGRSGGALAQLLPLFRLGLGGPVASGEQWNSWIHLDDLVGIYLLAVDGYDGILNATAPNPVTNREFTRALAAAVRRPALFPAPEFALKLIFGEGASVVTEGQRVLPAAALAAGYAFRYSNIREACASLVPRQARDDSEPRSH
ncbi:MAG TPA: TIGR01777 family oxidoreductase [Candidatus Lustribacter sp.]|jgi:hypothetical protein|nr:TIGR01777 family oxidoreductase [Candidatus Lustribacter sp.]